MYARIENGQVVEYPVADIRQRFPNSSIVDNDLPEGYVLVGVIPLPQVSPTQKVVPGAPIERDGKWVQSWDVVEMSAEELADRAAFVANQRKQVRAEAYREESDPLFFQEQRGEVPPGTWLAKVQEIKARYA